MDKQVIHKLNNSGFRSYCEALLALKTNLRVTSDQLQGLIALCTVIFSDENFIRTLQLEGVTTVPECLLRK